MSSLNHTHKYFKTSLGGEQVKKVNGKKQLIKTEGYQIFKCARDGCTSFMPLSIMLGVKSICWVCGEEMIMRAYNLKEKRPRHRECRKEKV